MAHKRVSNIIGFDDAPFPRNHKGTVKVVGAVFANLRFDGLLIGEIEKDGSDAAVELEKLITGSQILWHAQLIMLQGIALGGFNVIDVIYLNKQLALPGLVVARKQPDMESIKKALILHVPDGKKTWSHSKSLATGTRRRRLRSARWNLPGPSCRCH